MPKDLRSLAASQAETERFRLYLYDEVDSTNEVALQLGRRRHPGDAAVIADTQRRGRGRRGRSWFSPPGVNIYMSILTRPCLPPSSLTLMTLASSLAVVAAVESCPGIEGALQRGLWLKWPNDICWDGRKLGGILTETACSGGERFFVTGIGLNLNMAEEEIPPGMRGRVTSLYIETGRRIERGEMVIGILRAFRGFQGLLQDDPSSITALYCRMSRTIGRYVKAVTPGGSVCGKVAGVDERGFLRIASPGGEEVLTAADVVHLR